MYMHMHEESGSMRTTIELDAAQLEKLKSLAAQRGEKGYSKIISEALSRYFRELSDEQRAERRRAIERLKGSISDEEAEHMHRVVRELRENWR